MPSLVLLSSLTACTIFGGPTVTSESVRATAEAERALTVVYGVEARNTIENFESKWLGFEAHRSPATQSGLATGPYLEYWGYAREGTALYNEPSWRITRSAFVKSVRVLEYNPERFKAVACVIKNSDEVTQEGVVNETLSPLEICGVYVFVRQDSVWKLAGFFNTADPRDWDHAPDWLKQIIGELPSQ